MSEVPIIPGYSVGIRIGGGGFADVFRGREDQTRRDVALKVLRSRPSDAAAQLRFASEIQAMAILDRHRNIARIVDVVATTDGRPCIVMDYFPGGSLADQLRTTGPLRVRDVLSIGVQLCAAIQSAHLYQVWHRDIKPANILIGPDGAPQLADFGIAAVASAGSLGGPAGWSPAYVPPEVLLAASHGSTIDESQWDVYSLCATLYTLLSGHTPYEVQGDTNDNRTIADRVRNGSPQPLRVTGAPASLIDLLNHGVSRDPADRPRNPEDLFLRLRAVEQEIPGLPLTEYKPFRTGSVPTPAYGDTDLAPASTSEPSVPPAPVAEPAIVRADGGFPRGGGGEYTELNTDLSTPQAAPKASPKAPSKGQPKAPMKADPEGAKEEPDASPMGKRVLIGALAILVVIAVGWGVTYFIGSSSSPTTQPTQGGPGGSTPQEIVRTLPQPKITSVRQGSSIVFTWTYDQPAKGDFFHVTRPDQDVPTVTRVNEPRFVVEAEHACIDVVVYRVDGQGGPSARDCFPKVSPSP